jgi:hypothetical protein
MQILRVLEDINQLQYSQSEHWPANAQVPQTRRVLTWMILGCLTSFRI